MSDGPKFRRRNHFIKKGFQLNFSVRFLCLIIIEAVVLAGLFWYLSLDTLTTSYQGAQLRIENTSSFFFPSVIYPALIVLAVICVTGLIGLIFISHKIAGPLYRFEKTLKEIGDGDLTCRISLRKKDQLSVMADTLNNFTSGMDRNIAEMKRNIEEASEIVGRLEPHLASGGVSPEAGSLLGDVSKRITALKRTAEQFRTSGEIKDSESKGREA